MKVSSFPIQKKKKVVALIYLSRQLLDTYLYTNFLLYIHIHIHTLFYLISYIYTHTQPKKKYFNENYVRWWSFIK